MRFARCIEPLGCLKSVAEVEGHHEKRGAEVSSHDNQLLHLTTNTFLHGVCVTNRGAKESSM